MNKEAIEEHLQCIRTQLNALRGTDENILFIYRKGSFFNGTSGVLANLMAENSVRSESFANILTQALFLYRNMPQEQRKQIIERKKYTHSPLSNDAIY